MIQLKLVNNIKEGRKEINKKSKLRTNIIKKIIFQLWLKT